MKRDHSMVIGSHGRTGTLNNALSMCHAFGLTQQDAKSIIDDMIDIVSDWKSLAISKGLTEQQVKAIDWSILHQDIFAGYDKRMVTKSCGPSF